nr:recombinase family protein [Actinomadura sp. NAK00032]
MVKHVELPAGRLARPPCPEPAALEGGSLIGYAWVSTGRPPRWRRTGAPGPVTTLVVPLLDCLGRSLQDLILIVAGLRQRGIGFRSLYEAIDTTTPGGRLAFHVFAALAGFVR